VRENFPKCSVIGFGDRGWKLAKHVDKNAAPYNKEDKIAKKKTVKNKVKKNIRYRKENKTE